MTWTKLLMNFLFISIKMEKMEVAVGLLILFKSNSNCYWKKVLIKLFFDLLFLTNTSTKETLKVLMHFTILLLFNLIFQGVSLK